METLIPLELVEHLVLDAVSPDDIEALIEDVEILIRLGDEEPQNDEELHKNLSETAQTLLYMGKKHIKMFMILNKLYKENKNGNSLKKRNSK
jgi:hypothetical protein